MAESEFNRRQFGKRAAVTTAFGSFSLWGRPRMVQGQEPTQDTSDGDHQPAIAEPIPRPPIPLELVLLEVIRQTVSDRRLTDDVLEEIRRDISHELRRADRLRSVKLDNGDEPAATFAAYRAADPLERAAH